MVFALHLSRPTLVAIMLVSMAAISALNLSHQKADQFTLEQIDLAPWPQAYWQQWPISGESIWRAHWQQQPSQHITVIMRLDTELQYRWQLDTDQWSRQLQALLQQASIQNQLQSATQIGLAIGGPIAENQVRWILATIDHHLTRIKPSHGVVQEVSVNPFPQAKLSHLPHCITRFGITEQDHKMPQNGSQGNETPRNPNTQIIADPPQRLAMISQIDWTTDSWNQQRRQLARNLRYHWLEPMQQFDIQAELAYHRLAPNWIDKLYSELAGLSPLALESWLNCEISI